MKCINCGAEYRNDIEYCMRCGTYLKTGVTIIQNDQVNNTQRVDRESLVKIYIGDNYYKFIYKSLSFLYLFFGPLYGFSRKMYMYSIFNIVLLVIAYMCRIYVKEYLIVGATIVITLFFSLRFNNSYIRTARKRVDKLVLNNSSLDIVRLQDICRKLGGINWFFGGIAFIIGFILVVGTVICVLDLFDVINFLETNYLIELFDWLKKRWLGWFSTT